MRSTLGVYARIVVSIGNEGHKSSSALAVTIITLEVAECRLIFLGGGWPDELGSLVIRGQPTLGHHMVGCPPLVVIWWAEDASVMRQAMML